MSFQPDGTPFLAYVPRKPTGSNTWEDWLNRMRRPTEWGDNITLLALAQVLDVEIHVLSSTGAFHVINPFRQEGCKDILRLGHISECHYVSLISEGNHIN